MMQAMRKSSKIIFLIVLVAFAGFMILGYGLSIFGRGQGQIGQRGVEQGVIGKVNGVAVSSYAFDDAYRNKLQTLNKDDHEATDQEMEQARNDIWNNMTTISLIEQEATKHGIGVTDAEVADYMREGAGAPKDIKDSPTFQTNGQFDISKYQTWLQQAALSQDPRVQSFISETETQIRQQLLISRLQDFVVSMVRVTPEDAKADFVEKNDKAKVKYFFIPGGDYDSTVTSVPESEVKARFEKDKEQYKQPEMAVLTYVQFPIQSSESDLAQSKIIIDSLYQQVLAGANFDTLAKYRSQDPGSGAKGGDLGWFTEDRMVKPFSEATKNLKKIGEISQPIQTQFGWHIIKLTGRRTTKDKDGKDQTEYQASHILIKAEPSAATIAAVQQKANDFKADAQKRGIRQSAADFSLTATDTKPFAKGAYVADIGVNQALNDFSFTAKVGDMSDAVQTRNGIYICQLAKKNPAGYSTYADVKDRIQKAILREKRVEMAHKKGESLAGEISKGKTFDQVAMEAGKPIQETDYFNRTMFIPKIGNDVDFVGAAFGLSPTHLISGSVNSKTGAYILQYVDRQAADTSQFTAMSDSLTQSMANTKRKDIWSKWLNDTKQKADIQDFRSTYYGSGS